MASASGDFTIKLWDVSTGQSHLTLKHADIVQSLSWSANGALMVTTSRDKKLRVWDVRQEKPVHQYPGHEGAKNSRAVWMGEHNRIATTGFSRMSDRQIGLWEPGNPEPIGGFTMLDSISGVCMPFWGMLGPVEEWVGVGTIVLTCVFQMMAPTVCTWLAKGEFGTSNSLVGQEQADSDSDGNIRYFEYENDKFEFLSEHKSSEPQRGMAFLPRRGINASHDPAATANSRY